ncbi:Hypothetical protein NGAL_HAMBI2610_42020 [Neorhizobium galegae bv. orientalis]|nr:Hypothetical protein NGAL_HAMBI2610_42020 [Neorhizobium galegae bv. orientalis]
MALRAEGKETVRIAVSQFMEDVLALKDIEPLALKLFNNGVSNLAKCSVGVFLFVSSSDHLPQQYTRHVITAWATPRLRVVPYTLLANYLLGIALLLGSFRHVALLVGGASA